MCVITCQFFLLDFDGWRVPGSGDHRSWKEKKTIARTNHKKIIALTNQPWHSKTSEIMAPPLQTLPLTPLCPNYSQVFVKGNTSFLKLLPKNQKNYTQLSPLEWTRTIIFLLQTMTTELEATLQKVFFGWRIKKSTTRRVQKNKWSSVLLKRRNFSSITLRPFQLTKYAAICREEGGIGSANVCTFSKISLFKVLLQSGVCFLPSLRTQSKIKLFWTGFDMQGFRMRPITQG